MTQLKLANSRPPDFLTLFANCIPSFSVPSPQPHSVLTPTNGHSIYSHSMSTPSPGVPNKASITLSVGCNCGVRLSEGSRIFHNHGEGLYQDLLLFESAYQRLKRGEIGTQSKDCQGWFAQQSKSAMWHFQPGEGPSRGRLRNCEIFANLRCELQQRSTSRRGCQQSEVQHAIPHNILSFSHLRVTV